MNQLTQWIDKLKKAFINKIERVIEDKTVVIVTHKTSLLQLVDRVIIVENGQIIMDGPKEEVFKAGAR